MNIDAVWLGGPPGNRGHNIRNKLAKYGINFVAVHEYLSTGDKFPATTKAVILNVEMASHGMQDLGKREAARVGAVFVTGGFDVSRTINNLSRLGLIGTAEPVPAPPQTPAPIPTHIASKRKHYEYVHDVVGVLADDVDDPEQDHDHEPDEQQEEHDMRDQRDHSQKTVTLSPSPSPSSTSTPAPANDHGSVEAQAADALLSIERWPALRPFLLKGIVEALSKEAGMTGGK